MQCVEHVRVTVLEEKHRHRDERPKEIVPFPHALKNRRKFKKKKRKMRKKQRNDRERNGLRDGTKKQENLETKSKSTKKERE